VLLATFEPFIDIIIFLIDCNILLYIFGLANDIWGLMGCELCWNLQASLNLMEIIMYFDRFWSGNEAKQKKDKDRNNVLIGDWNEDKVVMD
jgi:hypothetical protein